MTSPLLPPGRTIAVVPPRRDALAAIVQEVSVRRGRRRRRCYAAALAVVPVALVVSLSVTRGSGRQSLEVVDGPSATPASVGPTGAARPVPGARHGVPVLSASPVATPSPSSSAAASGRPAGGPPALLEMGRGYYNFFDPTCPGTERSGWCLSVLADEPADGRPDPALALRICRTDPVDGSLTWQTTREAEIEVHAGATLAYRWSVGRTFRPDPHSERLTFQNAVGEDNHICLQWRLVWPVVDNAGRPLDRDVPYTLTARSYADGLSDVVVTKGFSAASPEG